MQTLEYRHLGKTEKKGLGRTAARRKRELATVKRLLGNRRDDPELLETHAQLCAGLRGSRKRRYVAAELKAKSS